jgi:hypothetical protein
MERKAKTDDLIRQLASEFRVMTLGGAAVIAHGLNRNTYDADIWVEPFVSPGQWAKRLAPLLYMDVYKPIAIGSWQPIEKAALADVMERDGVLRMMGLERPLDIFRRPNELNTAEFDEIWERGILLDDGTRLLEAVDLLASKQETGREKDTQDILFLEAKIEREYSAKLPGVDENTATEMLNRFLTPAVAEVALAHPSIKVRELAMRFLHELADEGNPFAVDILRRLGG